MEPSSHRLSPDDAEQRLLELLDADDLPLFASSTYHLGVDELELTWDHGLVLAVDLSQGMVEAFGDADRDAIHGHGCEPCAPACTPGLIVHHVQDLEPADDGA